MAPEAGWGADSQHLGKRKGFSLPQSLMTVKVDKGVVWSQRLFSNIPFLLLLGNRRRAFLQSEVGAGTGVALTNETCTAVMLLGRSLREQCARCHAPVPTAVMAVVTGLAVIVLGTLRDHSERSQMLGNTISKRKRHRCGLIPWDFVCFYNTI